jgi:hypothetical protein
MCVQVFRLDPFSTIKFHIVYCLFGKNSTAAITLLLCQIKAVFEFIRSICTYADTGDFYASALSLGLHFDLNHPQSMN